MWSTDNKTGDVRVNVTLRRFRVSIVAVEKPIIAIQGLSKRFER